jgi:signal transduction histidine kinase
MDTNRRMSRAGLVLAVAALAMGLVNIAVVLGTARTELLISPDVWLPLTATLTGALVVRQVPGNAVGWLLLGMALSSALFGASALVVIESPPVPALLTDAAAWLSAWVWLPSYLLGLVVLPMVFPDGRAAGRRWRPVLWLAVALLAAESVLLAFGSRESVEPGVPNPWVLEPVAGLLPVAEPLIWVGMPGLALIAVASLVLRLVRAEPAARLQIVTVLVAAAVGVAYWLLLESGLLVAVLLPTAIAVSVLRYRLYGVERLLVGTVTYGGLALTAAGFYLATVVAVTRLWADADDVRVQVSALVAAVLLIHPLKDRFLAFARRVVFGVRSRPYDALVRLARDIGAAVSPDQTMPLMAEAVATALDADHVRVTVARPDGALSTAEAGPVAEPGPSTDARAVVHHGCQVGRLEVWRRTPLRADEDELLAALVAQAGPALHAVRLTEELRAERDLAVAQAAELRSSRARLVTAHDTARRSLERDLHDGAQQGLLAMAVELGRIARRLPPDPDLAVRVAEVQELARRILVDVRSLASGTFPSALAELGVAAAVRERGPGLGPEVVVRDAHGRRSSPAVESAVFFSCMEAVANAAKHAGCSRIEVSLHAAPPDGLQFVVRDDGAGFCPDQVVGDGTGLLGMADRLGALGGGVEVDSAPGAGTTVRGTAYEPGAGPTESGSEPSEDAARYISTA